MSPASKSKSKDKKVGKDPLKVPLKPSGLANMASDTLVSGYNPHLGKFHTIAVAPFSSASSLQVNGRFRNIDDTDDFYGNSGGNGPEYDTLSNNDSWSGESEDHKDKTNSLQREAIPGADSDKREKIRQKNERKHLRQKERRALELHERCNSFLMSRKLESLSQQLIAMGFSQERATMALILNEGKIEDSVAWLFEGGKEAADTRMEHFNLDGGNLKIDISDELAHIADMEIRYECSRQEVERAIVTCEGDLEKTADTLRVQKQDSPSAEPDETGEPPTPTNGKFSQSNCHNPLRIPANPMSCALSQLRRENKDFNYSNAVATNVVVAVESGGKIVHALKKPESKLEQVKPQQIMTPVDKRWSAAVTNPSVSHSPLSPLQMPPHPTNTEGRRTALGSEIKNLQLGSVKEPVIVMQRPKSAKSKQAFTASMSLCPPNAAPSGGWYPNKAESVKPNELPKGFSSHIVPSTRSLASHNGLSSSNQLYSQLHYQLQHHHPQYMPNNGITNSTGASRGNDLWSRMGGSSPTLAVASSLGLFIGLGSNSSSGSSSLVDWNTGASLQELDYANIDWSLDRSSRPSSFFSSSDTCMWNNIHGYDAYASGPVARTAMSPSAMANGGSGSGLAGLQDGEVVVAASGETSSAGARWWSSPFEEKDIFNLPKQSVSSPP